MSQAVKNSPLCDNEPVTIVDLLETDIKAARYLIEVLDPNANKVTEYTGQINETQLSSFSSTACLLKFD